MIFFWAWSHTYIRTYWQPEKKNLIKKQLSRAYNWHRFHSLIQKAGHEWAVLSFSHLANASFVCSTQIVIYFNALLFGFLSMFYLVLNLISRTQNLPQFSMQTKAVRYAQKRKQIKFGLYYIKKMSSLITRMCVCACVCIAMKSSTRTRAVHRISYAISHLVLLVWSI